MIVSADTGRKDRATQRISGRARDNRLVHVSIPDGATEPRPGDIVTTVVTHGAPHHLVADSLRYSLRRTRAGDIWEAAPASPPEAPAGISLGIPTIRIGA